MKNETLLQGVEVTIIGTLAAHPETFRQVRDVLRPEMFPSEEGEAIAEKLWPHFAKGWNKNLAAVDLKAHQAANVEKAMQSADADNLRTAAELLAANWADGKYQAALKDVALNWNTFSDWREADGLLNTAKRQILHMSAGKVATPGQVVEEVMQDMWDGLLGQKTYSGIPSGFDELDELTGGWQPKQQIVVGGRPGMGKTRFAVSCTYHAAKAGYPVAFFSQEISKEMIYRYLLAYMTDVSVGDMKSYDLPKERMDQVSAASKILAEMPIYVIDDAFTSDDVEYVAREIAQQHGVKLIVVDYIQRLRLGGKRPNGRHDELTEISSSLKDLARGTGAATMVLSQISRKATDRAGQVPTMADLRDSGAIEADADIILFPYRPKNPDPENPVRIIVEKQRDGELGDVAADWRSPGFYYNPSDTEAFDALPEWKPALNGKAKAADETEIPF